MRTPRKCCSGLFKRGPGMRQNIHKIFVGCQYFVWRDLANFLLINTTIDRLRSWQVWCRPTRSSSSCRMKRNEVIPEKNSEWVPFRSNIEDDICCFREKNLWPWILKPALAERPSGEEFRMMSWLFRPHLTGEIFIELDFNQESDLGWLGRKL